MQKKDYSIILGLPALMVFLIFLVMPSFRDNPAGNRKVVLYCSVDQSIAEPIIARFEERFKTKVLTRFDTEASKTVGLVQRIRSESSRPIADVFWSSEVFHTIRLAREGLLDPFYGMYTRYWPRTFCDRNRLWYGFALRVRVIAYNSNRVSPDEAPRSLEDLLDAKWKGRLVMARPEFGTTGGDVASWFAHYGKDRAEEILRSLKANEIRLVDGNSTAVRMVATGQADVCMTDTDDVFAAKRNGWPVEMNRLDQGGKGALAIPNTAAIIKGAPNPNEASRLMAFLLGATVEDMLAKSESRNYPIHSSVIRKSISYEVGKTLAIRYEDIADNLPTAIATASEILH
ncbi:MAG: extracellular solute-binding protein [Planctomycetes bacterium]|nr:extracellular solute-binding protein [Planctomycetota bacterium]